MRRATGAAGEGGTRVKRLAQGLSALALGATLLPPLFFFADKVDLPTAKQVMLVAAVLWLVATPFWMEHKTD
jgi:hypothetical protein